MTRAAFCLILLLTTATAAGAQSLPAGLDRKGLDPATRPGDDFEQYANGGWRADTEIPPDRSNIGAFVDVSILAETRLAALFGDIAKSRGAPGSESAKIADYYAAYMDMAGIEARGLAPLRPQLAAIAALKDKRALATLLAADVRADEDPLNTADFQTENIFGLFVTQDLNAPAVTVPYVLQGGLGMASRDYYLSDKADMRAIRDAYRGYIATVFELAGYDDPAARAGRVLALETKLAATHESYEDSQDAHKANNPWTLADFAAKAPGIDWRGFWTAAGLLAQARFIVWQPGAVTGAAALVAGEPLAAWQDWLVFHAINKVAAVLPSAFQAANFGFYGTTMSGTKAQRPRDRRAIAATNAALGDAVGKLYVQRYFAAASKRDIQAMVANILKAFDTRVAGLDWMAPATKAEARRKIQTMQVGIGYPDHWLDYTPLEIRADDPVGNMQRAELATTRRQLAKIGRPVDRGEWWMFPQTVNAVNLPLQNALNFPAAILDAPFYDPKRDPAANYGAIGATIGHEISHSFDNVGADFDASGRLRNWWTPADLKRFDESGAALVRQYDAYEALPGVHVKGRQTLGENIADVAGLTAALEAYHAALGGRPAPVIDGMTGDQRLFLSFALTWRAKFREATLRARIETDGHAPAKYRAETVRNLDAWYDAFGIKPATRSICRRRHGCTSGKPRGNADLERPLRAPHA